VLIFDLALDAQSIGEVLLHVLDVGLELEVLLAIHTRRTPAHTNPLYSYILNCFEPATHGTPLKLGEGAFGSPDTKRICHCFEIDRNFFYDVFANLVGKIEKYAIYGYVLN